MTNTFDAELFTRIDFENILLRETPVDLTAQSAEEILRVMLTNPPAVNSRFRNALIFKMAQCAMKISPSDEAWKEQNAENINNVLTMIDAKLQALDTRNKMFKALLAEKGLTMVEDEGEIDSGDELDTPTKQPRIIRIDKSALMPEDAGAIMEAEDVIEQNFGNAGAQLRQLNRDIAVAKQVKDEHAGLRDLSSYESGELSNLLMSELTNMPAEEVLPEPKPEANECKALLNELRDRVGGPLDMEPLLSLRDVNDQPTELAQMLALMYAYAKSGVIIQTYEMAMALMRSLRAGAVATGSVTTVGTEFLNSPLSEEINYVNKIIKTGYLPKRWREAFQKPGSGLVDRMLGAWEGGGYKQLTLPEIYTLFVPNINAGGVASLIIPMDPDNKKEDQVIRLANVILDATSNERTKDEQGPLTDAEIQANELDDM